MNSFQTIYEIAKRIETQNGRCYYVGGYSRDLLLGIENNDFDIEVHGITEDILNTILSDYGFIKCGKSFGIYTLTSLNIDIALPRTEIKTGNKHNDFDVSIDPFIGIQKAAMRRDFTINSIYIDVLTNEIIDYYNGVNDLKNKIIRHINDKSFVEDPLRVLRCAMFASRLEFEIAKDTINLCKSIDITTLSKERVYNELIKALTKSNKPSIFFNVLREMNHLSYFFKEINDLINVNQRDDYHREGDVYNHTMLVLDEGAKVLDKVIYKEAFMLSLLLHDAGKKVATKLIDNIYHSYNHDILGVEVVKEFLNRLTNNNKIITYVCNMVRYHMLPNIYAKDNSKVKVTNKLFFNSICPNDLIYVSICDNYGRISKYPITDHSKYLFDRLHIYNSLDINEKVTGKDLINLNIKEGKIFKELLDIANNLYLSNVSKNEALKQIISTYKKKS